MGGSKRQVVGIMYYLGFHMVLCHYCENLTINKIACGERPAWSGAVSANTKISINQPNLFGGVTKEGGVQGGVDILLGASTQAKNSYLMGQLGASIPAFRGVVSFVANQIYCCAGSPYIKPWWTQLTAIVQEDWYGATADIGGGSANAAHMIRECLVNEDWGMGIDESELNDTAFRAFALAIYNEGFGLSMLLTNQDSIDKFIAEVLKHVQGVIYADRTTGQITIKLIREDYVIADLPVFDESNIIKVNSYDKPSPAEILNEVIVKYRPRGDTKDAAAAYQNLASVENQSGIVSKTVTYPGIDTHANAAIIGARELRTQSAQLSKTKITTNRDAWNLTLGSVFKYSWSDYNLDTLIMRVNNINYGKLDSHEIIIDAVEDVFALSQASYIVPGDTDWSDPVQDPSALTTERLEESTWWDLANNIDPANLALIETNTTASYLVHLGIENVASPGYELWERVGTILNPSFANEGQYVPDALLVAALDLETTLDIDIVGLNTIEATTIEIGQYAVIDDEYIRIDEVDEVANTINIGRGCLDTIPAEHAAGARIWFSEINAARSETEYSTGVTVRAQAKVETALGFLSLDPLNEKTILMDARQNKPYPPGKFEINSLAYPTVVDGGTVLTVTWAHRDRLQQTATILDHTNISVGPEAGVTYELYFYDENDVLRKTVTGLTGTTYTWATETADSLLTGRLNTSVRVELKTVRGGVYSWQYYDHTVVRAGYGYNYGYFYGGDA